MKAALKGFVFNILGLQGYLRLLHWGFRLAYKSGYLRNNYIYKVHYFVPELVKPGDVVIDLGANLGYYSYIFSNLVGANGKVISIEPVKPFYQTLLRALSNKKQVQTHNVALGTEAKTIQMVIPKIGPYLRTGLAHVRAEDDQGKDQYEFDVDMVRGSELFNKEEKINYIKCDIEGYEEIVIPEIKNIIAKHRPIVQIETWGSGKVAVDSILKPLDYIEHSLDKGKLYRTEGNPKEFGDYIFIPKERIETFKHLIA